MILHLSCPRAAVIDVGTNSVKVIIGERDEKGAVRILMDSVRFPRLGQGLNATGKLSQKAEERTLAAIRELLEIAQQHQAEKIRLVGTSALREARNREELLLQVHREFGMDLEVLSGQDEARLSYEAVARDASLEGCGNELCVVDIGGGSTELIFGQGTQMSFCRSLRLGAVKLTEQVLRTDPPDGREIGEASRMAEEAIQDAVAGRGANRVVGVGGTVVNLARIRKGMSSRETEKVHGMRMTPSDCRKLLDRLSGLGIVERGKLVGLDPERADIILAGSIILDRLLSVLGAEELLVSRWGLRYGRLLELLPSRR
jgi:exopolyphosphatase / guanosine-5'-triphosphate,3'-diphosphate pyrophosphatase